MSKPSDQTPWTCSTQGLIHSLRALALDIECQDGVPGPTLAEAAERMDTMQRLLDRAADIIAYPIGSSREKWLADAKVIGIEPCPF